MIMYITAALAFIADLVTKSIATHSLSDLPGHRVAVIPGYLDFLLAGNTGAAFSMLDGHAWVITAISIVAIAVIFLWSRKVPRNVLSAQISFGLIFGGAAGNLVDRFRFGYVVDFIHVYRGSWFFPTFNVADTAITIGIVLFIYLSLFTKKLEPQPVAEVVEAPADAGKPEQAGT